MLILKPDCECCDKDLPPDGHDAVMCSFECTFCSDCKDHRLPGGLCPNCGGELLRSPIRPAGNLSRFPPSAERVLKAHPGCAA